MTLRSKIKTHLPWPLLYIYRKIYYFPKDASAAFAFPITLGTRSPTDDFWPAAPDSSAGFMPSHITWIALHTEHEFLTLARRILDLGSTVPGVIAEAGAYHGGSTAKLSLVAGLCGRKLEVFDSFEGMPEKTMKRTARRAYSGREHHFPKGSHAVGLETVKGNVTAYGDVSRCGFHKGFFSDTLPSFKEPVAVACINVDLVQSTKDCLKYFYPLIQPGHGLIFSQDAHFSLDHRSVEG